MNASLWGTLLIVGGGIVVQLLINRSNRQGQQATNAIEQRQVDLDDRKVDKDEFDAITRELRASLTDAREETKSFRAEVAMLRGDLKDEKAAHRVTRDRLDKVVESQREHSEWDKLAAEVARRLDPKFPDPPPFFEPAP